MRGAVDTTTNYAYQWLPADFRNKNISSFGRSVFQNIITDTIGNNRTRIIEKINRFDEVARAEEENLNRKKGVNVTGIIEVFCFRFLFVSTAKPSTDLMTSVF